MEQYRNKFNLKLNFIYNNYLYIHCTRFLLATNCIKLLSNQYSGKKRKQIFSNKYLLFVADCGIL